MSGLARHIVGPMLLAVSLSLASRGDALPFTAPVWGVINLPVGYAGTLYVWGGQLFGSQQGGIYVSTDTGITWTPLHDGLPNRYIRAFAVSPDAPEVLLAAPEQNGIYRSTDGGASWTPVLPNLTVYHLEVDGADSQLVLAGTEGRGVFRSTDFGATWSEANAGLKGLNLTSITVSTTDPDRLYVAHQGLNTGGIMVTTNGGATWEDVSPSTQRQNVVLVSRTDADLVIAGNDGPWGSDPYGIYVSTDGGASWANHWIGADKDDVFALHIPPALPSRLLVGTQVWLDPWLPRIVVSDDWGSTLDALPGIPAVETGIARLATRPDDAATIFAVGQSGLGVIRSTDGGANWTAFNPGIADDNPDQYFRDVVVDPSAPDVVWAGGVGLYRSTDGGDSWVTIAAPDEAGGDVRSLAVRADGTIVVGGWADCQISDDGGASFTSVVDGLPASGALVQLALAAPDATALYAAVSGNGAYRLDDGTTTWVSIGPLGEDVPRILGRRHGQETMLAAGSADLYYSTDAGQTWQVAAVEADAFFGPTALGRDGAEPGRALMGTLLGLFVSEDGGASWTELSAAGLPTDLSVGAIGFDPEDDDTLLIASAGSLSDSSGALYLSTDGATSFATVGNGLPPAQIGALGAFAFRSESTHKVWASVGDGFAGTAGFHHSHDGGRNWAEPAPYVDSVQFVDDALELGAEQTAATALEAVNHVGEPAASPLEGMITLVADPEVLTAEEATAFSEPGVLDLTIVAGPWNGTYEVDAACSGCRQADGDKLAVTISGGLDPADGVDAGADGGTGSRSSDCGCRVVPEPRHTLLTLLLALF